ncbi:MAG: protease inhibitor I42 family protein [Verrucomicrobiales bacterium]|jgi:inhibitor of cysteine peptidase|nr:protease inhibitor I42 family protein [Verrucomicrobiales bacterium]
MRNQGFTLLLLASLAAIFTLLSCKKSGSVESSAKQADSPACCSMLGAMTTDALLLTEKDNGTRVAVKRGQTVVISLPSNPTTGFNWYLRPLPEFLLSERNPEYHPESDRIGGGGLWILKVKSMGAGNGAVNIDYKRSFEDDKEPTKIFTISVEAK